MQNKLIGVPSNTSGGHFPSGFGEEKPKWVPKNKSAYFNQDFKSVLLHLHSSAVVSSYTLVYVYGGRGVDILN